MSLTYRLNLLGLPELRAEDSGTIRFRTRKHLALVIYLILEASKKPVSRPRVVELFWPESEPSRGRQSLRQALTDIRARLGVDTVTTSRHEIQFHGTVLMDLDSETVSTFRTAAPPIPLEGLEQVGGLLFGQWLDLAREQILTRVRSRLSTAIKEARSSGSFETAIERAEQLYRIDPFNDSAVQAIVAKRLSSGDWSGALGLLRKHISESETQLGRSPHVDVLATLRRFEGGFMIGPHEDQPEDPVDPESSNETSSPRVFIGRSAELARLDGLLKEVRNGQFRACALVGPEGIGKTTVLRCAAASFAAQNDPVYLVSCQRIGSTIPFAAISALLEQLSRDPSLSATDSASLAEASLVAPRIKLAYPGIREPVDVQPETVRPRLASAIRNMLEAVADDRLVVVAFDDVQNMDSASREVLHLLVRKLVETPMLLLATASCSEIEVAAGGGEGLEGVDWHEVIHLDPLDDVHTANLVRSHSEPSETIDSHVIARIVQLAQGNPYLAEMLVADWKQNGANSIAVVDDLEQLASEHWRPSDTMRRALQRQSQALPKESLHLACLLAVAGRALPMDDIPSILGLDATIVRRGALTLVERKMARLDEGMLNLRNDIHRAYLCGVAMTAERRQFYHASLTSYFKATRSQKHLQQALEASHHALRADSYDDAIRFACIGADLALASGAGEEAQSALEAVRDKWPNRTNVEAAILLAKAHSAQGSYECTLNALHSVRTEETGVSRQAVAAYLQAEALHRGRLSEDYDTLSSAAHKAFVLAEKVDNGPLAVQSLQIGAEIAHELGRWDALRMIEDACTELERESQHIEVRGLANLTLGYCRLVSGEPSVALHFFSSASQLLESLRLDSKQYRSLIGLAMSASNMDRFNWALDAFKSAVVVAERCGDAVAHANALLNIGSLSNDLGRFTEAADCFRDAINLDSEISTSRVSTAIYCNAANLAIAIGSFGEAAEFLRIATSAAERSGLWQHLVTVLLTKADLHLANGDPSKAWGLVSEALSNTGSRHRLVPDQGQYWRLRRHYYAVTGEGDAITLGTPTSITNTHLLELQVFEDWYKGHYHGEGECCDAVTALVELGLFGVLARLAALGVRVSPFDSTPKETPGAIVIKDAYPEMGDERVPQSVLR